ncbi:glycosyltransferase family 2 protein [Vibrio aestuarianus]|uniref:glycosyltransferase family 2 protein n=1 Tax=Vibrio aestuarianus TaxID=28171 RepID=UPI001558F7FF|nr:glycosyltransferase family 2 protein [Vibrio aestuarianus]NGZ15552.1 glycosyltransferase family 2 protein [Vibrio aestuarianus]NKZ51700.1 glycosyltransferase family 2 protein [Vibrio aestuarianus]
MSSKKIKDVAVVVTTFNPDIDLLVKNIMSYIGQCGAVYLVDNSPLPFDYEALPDKVVVLSLENNLGIAHAQNIGISEVKNDGYQYIIEIDQDSSLSNGYVEGALVEYEKLNAKYGNVFGIGPVAISDVQGIDYYGYSERCDSFIVEHTLSSGFFYPVKNANQCGEKNTGLFIDLVDWEWCYRARQHGLYTFISPNLFLFHSLGEGHIIFGPVKIGVPKPFRHYYQMRNTILLSTMPHVPIKWKVKNLIKVFVKLIGYPIIMKQGFIRLKYMLRGIRDGVLGVVGPLY